MPGATGRELRAVSMPSPSTTDPGRPAGLLAGGGASGRSTSAESRGRGSGVESATVGDIAPAVSADKGEKAAHRTPAGA
jgi:hypothetical protein